MIRLIIIAFLAQQSLSLPTNTSSCWGNFCTCLGDYITKLVEQKINDKNIDSSERIPFQYHAKDDPFAPYKNGFMSMNLPLENNIPLSEAPKTQSVDKQINKLNNNQENKSTDQTKSEMSKNTINQSHQIYSHCMGRPPTVMYCPCAPKTIPCKHYFNCSIAQTNITKPDKPKTESDPSGESIVKTETTSEEKKDEELQQNKKENVGCNNLPLKGISLYLSGKSPCYYTCCHCSKHCFTP